tara:strand:- start:1130 stop:1720 length:591 start_codon:yes stop_codon:yes gene_type:complete
MANHVYFNVTVDGNEECLKGFTSAMELTSVERKHWNSEETYVVRELLDIDKLKFMPEGTYDKEGDLEDGWNYYVNNVGAKWCNVEEVEEDYFSGYSAWCAPLQFIQYLHEYLYDHHDKNHSIKMTYEDEFRNFIGVAHYENANYDIEELDSGDLMELMRDHFGDVVDDENFWDSEYEEGDPSEIQDEIVWEWFQNN